MSSRLLVLLLLLLGLWVAIKFISILKPKLLHPSWQCVSDEDCVASGCNKEICSNKVYYTPCEYREYYFCFKLTECRCINNTCVWERTTPFLQCLAKFNATNILENDKAD